jgi:glycerol-3-phosphate dehydrogenase
MKITKLNKKIKKIDANISAFEKDGCIHLVGEVDEYSKVVKAGRLAVNKKYLGVVNNVKVKGSEVKMLLPDLNDKALDKKEVDVLIIGGGVTGCAVLRELSKYKLKSLLVEKGNDLAVAQSSRNGGVVHVGLNFSKKSLKLKYCVKGNAMYQKLCEDLHVPYENKGQVTFARNPLEMIALYFAARGGKAKGIDKLQLMSRKKLLQIEPSVPEWSCGGLFMGTGGITCPHRLTFALAENAVENGAEVALNTAVLDMKLEGDRIVEVITNRGVIYPKAVVNAAGVYADVIADMAQDRTFTIHPRAGTDLICDKKVGYLVNSSLGKTPFTLSPEQIKSLPKRPFAIIKATLKNLHSHSKGVGLIHSVDGNMLVGPNALEVMDREDYTTDRKVVDSIIKVQQEVQPKFKKSDVIAYFTGVRSPTYEEDFVVRPGIKTKNIFEAAGIQSPGLTAAPAIAIDMAKWIVDYLRSNGEKVEENKTFNPKRNHKPVLSELSLEERNQLIKQNPDYGEIICRCEEISKGEIIDALRSPIPVYTVDGIKKRVRPGMGRCQGAFCLPLVMKIISEEGKIEMKEIVKSTPQSVFVFKETK